MKVRTQLQLMHGFTLIELLVVIAIIGVLSAVVLSALGAAKNKSGDAAVQTDLDSIRSQAEIYYLQQNPNTYGVAALSCTAGLFSDSVVARSLTNATANGTGSPICNSNGSAYVAEAGLKSAGGYWCVDSAGTSRRTTTAVTTGVYSCP